MLVRAEQNCTPSFITVRAAQRRGIAVRPQRRHRAPADCAQPRGVAGALGRGGSYTINASNEPAIGFSLYPDRLIDLVAAAEPPRDTLFLPLGHDTVHAARLRAIGWRTVAALGPDCDAAALGCSHRLTDSEAVRL